MGKRTTPKKPVLSGIRLSPSTRRLIARCRDRAQVLEDRRAELLARKPARVITDDVVNEAMSNLAEALANRMRKDGIDIDAEPAPRTYDNRGVPFPFGPNVD